MKHKKHNVKHTHIQHHPDGSHTVKHIMDDGSSHSSAHGDINALQDHMQDAMGQPNPGEAAADAGQHGVPAEQAASAGLPMPAAGGM